MKVLITGGSGSLGSAIVRRLIKKDCKVRILSRNEKNQDFLKRELNNPNVEFYIGDIRNKQRVREVMNGCDTVIHCAALKYIPICIKNTWEAIDTNLVGIKTMLSMAVKYKVKNFIAISTDKAVMPSSAYGYTKALMENMFAEAGRLFKNTKFVCIRLGNLVKSRGSVYEIWKKQIDEGKPLTITDPTTKRFFITLNNAARYILQYDSYESGTIVVPKMKCCNVGMFAEAMEPINGIEIIGLKLGEKRNEVLIGNESVIIKDDYYVVYPYGKQGKNMFISTSKADELTLEEMKKMIKEG